ncbi:MAG: hypothetical protein QW486_05460 [Candidatus Bathyarchaeia archaeon]
MFESASTARTLYPSLAKSLERVAAMKVFPTPPLPATESFRGFHLSSWPLRCRKSNLP